MLRKVLPLILLVVATAVAHAEKVSGFVKGSPTGKTFVVGSKEGTFTVDASKARVTMKGKFFSIASLTGGSQVTVEGTMKGKDTIVATTVNVGFVRAPGKGKTAASGAGAAAAGAGAAAAAGTKGKSMKDKMKDKMSGMKDKMKGMKDKMSGKDKKPSTAAKAKDNTKGKATGKAKTDSKPKTDSKAKGKTKTDSKAKAGDKAGDKAKTGN